APCGHQSSFIEKVLKVGPGEARSTRSKRGKINRFIKRFVFRMYFKHRFTASHIRTGDRNLPVETAGTEQCRVKDVGSVCCGNHDDAFVFAKAIHLHKKLVERLLTLIVAAADTGTTLTADCIDLIDEDDT